MSSYSKTYKNVPFYRFSNKNDLEKQEQRKPNKAQIWGQFVARKNTVNDPWKPLEMGYKIDWPGKFIFPAQLSFFLGVEHR